MNLTSAVFYILSAILIFAGVRVITAKNPVHAALYLVLAFFSASGIWLLLRAEFLAIALVLVYVGAVMVLFLFVVMMLDINFDQLRERFRSYVPVGTVEGALILAEMLWVLAGGYLSGGPAALNSTAVSSIPNTKVLGLRLYTEFVYPFEIAAVILLVAIIAAIALTHRQRAETKKQDPSKQVRVHRNDRLRIVKMPASKPESPVEVKSEAKSN